MCHPPAPEHTQFSSQPVSHSPTAMQRSVTSSARLTHSSSCVSGYTTSALLSDTLNWCGHRQRTNTHAQAHSVEVQVCPWCEVVCGVWVIKVYVHCMWGQKDTPYHRQQQGGGGLPCHLVLPHLANSDQQQLTAASAASLCCPHQRCCVTSISLTVAVRYYRHMNRYMNLQSSTLASAVLSPAHLQHLGHVPDSIVGPQNVHLCALQCGLHITRLQQPVHTPGPLQLRCCAGHFVLWQPANEQRCAVL